MADPGRRSLPPPEGHRSEHHAPTGLNRIIFYVLAREVITFMAAGQLLFGRASADFARPAGG
jgi:hypothetical protein